MLGKQLSFLQTLSFRMAVNRVDGFMIVADLWCMCRNRLFIIENVKVLPSLVREVPGDM